jgi:uncharacterized protein
MQKLISLLSQKTSLETKQIENILTLLEDGSTIPFIARYRKEMTGGASDEQLREFEEVYQSAKKFLERQAEILNILDEKQLLTAKLKSAILSAQTITALEDLYRPFKEKKNTRASVAIAQGLESLADLLQKGSLSRNAFEKEAAGFLKGDVKSVEDAIKGAQDIVAERFSDDAKEREVLRNLTLKHGILEVKAAKGFKKEGQFVKYESHSEKVAFIPSHR